MNGYTFTSQNVKRKEICYKHLHVNKVYECRMITYQFSLFGAMTYSFMDTVPREALRLHSDST